MRSSSKKFAAVLVTVVLSISVIATPVSAAVQRDDRRDGGSRVARVVKQLLKHFGIRSNEEISVPKP